MLFKPIPSGCLIRQVATANLCSGPMHRPRSTLLGPYCTWIIPVILAVFHMHDQGLTELPLSVNVKASWRTLLPTLELVCSKGAEKACTRRAENSCSSGAEDDCGTLERVEFCFMPHTSMHLLSVIECRLVYLKGRTYALVQLVLLKSL